MDATAIIDQVVTDVLNLAPSDGDNTATRGKILRGLIEVSGYVFNYRDWRFRRGTASITIANGVGFGILPADFLRIGDYGGVFLVSTGAQLESVTEQELIAIRSIPGSSTGNPLVYSLFGLDTASMTPTYQKLIQIPTNTGTVILSVSYETQLIDSDDSTGADNIKLLPEVWHQAVLMPGLRAMFRQNVGDGRYQDFRQDAAFRDALRQMVKQEHHGDETTRSLPNFFGA